MFILVSAAALTAGILARLAVVVRGDRPAVPPRSHDHEV